MGCYATALPGGVVVGSRERGRSVGAVGLRRPGRARPDRPGDARRGERWTCSSPRAGTSWTCCPNPAVPGRPTRIPLRIHMDIVLSDADAGGARRDGAGATRDDAVRGPGWGDRDEHRAPGDPLSPEIAGPRMEEARPEWEVLWRWRGERPDRARGIGFASPVAPPRFATRSPRWCRIRRDRGAARSREIVPVRGGAAFPERSRVQDPGRPGAVLTVVEPPEPVRPRTGRLPLSTRRGKQFNSMVQERQGRADRRAAARHVLISADDADGSGMRDGDARPRSQSTTAS